MDGSIFLYLSLAVATILAFFTRKRIVKTDNESLSAARRHSESIVKTKEQELIEIDEKIVDAEEAMEVIDGSHSQDSIDDLDEFFRERGM